MSPPRPTAIVVDDATFTRQSLPALMPKLNITADFATAQQLISSGARADLVILEIQRADKCPDEVRQGLDGLRLATGAGHRVCVYTQEARPFVHAACLAAGAKGVVSRAASLPVTQDGFLEVARGSTIITQGLINAFDLLPRRRQLTVINPRQRTILSSRARQLSLTEIAEQLEIPLSVVQEEWRIACVAVSRFLQEACLEVATNVLGLIPGELGDIWPQPQPRCPESSGVERGPLLTS
jgi:DNA-binding NarL/FixJ family response regulator